MLNLRFQRINLKAELELPAGDNCRFYELLESIEGVKVTNGIVSWNV